MLFPNAPVRTVFFLGFIVFFRDVQAKWLLVLWFLSQFLVNSAEGVAWMAHVGGFVFGVLVGLFWRATSRPQAAGLPVFRI
jgi:membrane associated rhomboid family serine protease